MLLSRPNFNPGLPSIQLEGEQNPVINSTIIEKIDKDSLSSLHNFFKGLLPQIFLSFSAIYTPENLPPETIKEKIKTLIGWKNWCLCNKATLLEKLIPTHWTTPVIQHVLRCHTPTRAPSLQPESIRYPLVELSNNEDAKNEYRYIELADPLIEALDAIFEVNRLPFFSRMAAQNLKTKLESLKWAFNAHFLKEINTLESIEQKMDELKWLINLRGDSLKINSSKEEFNRQKAEIFGKDAPDIFEELYRICLFIYALEKNVPNLNPVYDELEFSISLSRSNFEDFIEGLKSESPLKEIFSTNKTFSFESFEELKKHVESYNLTDPRWVNLFNKALEKINLMLSSQESLNFKFSPIKHLVNAIITTLEHNIFLNEREMLIHERIEDLQYYIDLPDHLIIKVVDSFKKANKPEEKK